MAAPRQRNQPRPFAALATEEFKLFSEFAQMSQSLFPVEESAEVLAAKSSMKKKCIERLKDLKVNESDIDITLGHFIKECIEIISWLETEKKKVSIIYYAYPLKESFSYVVKFISLLDPSYLPELTFNINKDSLKVGNAKSNMLGINSKNFPPADTTFNAVYVPVCYASTGDTLEEQEEFKLSLQLAINTFALEYKIPTINIHPYLGPHDATKFLPTENELKSKKEVLSDWLNKNKDFFKAHDGMKFLIDEDKPAIFKNKALRKEWNQSPAYLKAKEVFYKMLCDGRFEKLQHHLISDVCGWFEKKSQKEQLRILKAKDESKAEIEEEKSLPEIQIEANDLSVHTKSYVEISAAGEPTLAAHQLSEVKEVVVNVSVLKIDEEKRVDAQLQTQQASPKSPSKAVADLFFMLNHCKHRYLDKLHSSMPYGEMALLISMYYMTSFSQIETAETITIEERIRYLKYFINVQINFGIQLVLLRRPLYWFFDELSNKIKDTSLITKFKDGYQSTLSSISAIKREFCPIECEIQDFRLTLLDMENNVLHTPKVLAELVSEVLTSIYKLSLMHSISLSYKTYISIFNAVAKSSLLEADKRNRFNIFSMQTSYMRWKILSEIRAAAFEAFQSTMKRGHEMGQIEDYFEITEKSPKDYTHEALGESLFSLPLAFKKNITSTAVKMKALCKELTDFYESRDTIEYLLDSHLERLQRSVPNISIFRQNDLTIPRGVKPDTFTRLIFSR